MPAHKSHKQLKLIAELDQLAKLINLEKILNKAKYARKSSQTGSILDLEFI